MLDQNESSEDFPNELKALVLERIAKVEWNRYPDLNAETMRAHSASSRSAGNSTSCTVAATARWISASGSA